MTRLRENLYTTQLEKLINSKFKEIYIYIIQKPTMKQHSTDWQLADSGYFQRKLLMDMKKVWHNY